MKIQVIENDIFANGEKVATILDDPKKSSIVDAFRDEMMRRDNRWN